MVVWHRIDRRHFRPRTCMADCGVERGVENVGRQYATNYNFFYGWLHTVRFQRPLFIHSAENSEARSSFATLWSSRPASSFKNLSLSDGSWIFRLANGFFFFFFFFKKSGATGGQTLRRPDSRLTCAAHRISARPTNTMTKV